MTPWTAVPQAPLSMGFPRQENWSGLPFAAPGWLSFFGKCLVQSFAHFFSGGLLVSLSIYGHELHIQDKSLVR